MSDRKEYKNEVVTGLWGTKGKHLKSMSVDAKSFDNLQKIGVGDQLFIRFRTEDAIANSDNPDTTPIAYFERIPKEEVEAYKAANPKPRGNNPDKYNKATKGL